MIKVNKVSLKIIEAARKLKIFDDTFILILAALVGLTGGYFAIAFRYLIVYVTSLLGILCEYISIGLHYLALYISKIFSLQHSIDIDAFTGFQFVYILFIPIIGLMLVAFITNVFAKEAKGHGVPEVMSAVTRKGGIIRPRIVLIKMFVSAICIGSGGSVGREGPIVQIGSAIGSFLGQFFKMSSSAVTVLVGCGAAAGISATFNAPIAGTLFASEVILRDIRITSVSPILISSLVAASVSRAYYGNSPAFVVSHYELASYGELGLYCVLGLFAGLIAVLFVKILYKTEDIFDAINIHWLLKAAIGGLLLGLVGMYHSEVHGVGYGVIEEILNNPGQYGVIILSLLCVLKIIMTSVTIGAGGSGGVFAPSLFMGAALGGLFGICVQGIPYFGIASPGAYALVGMSAVVAGTTHAPIQAILILVEMTGNYEIILPIMISCVISNVVSKKIESGSIYTMKLIRRGESIEIGKDKTILKKLRVADVIVSNCMTIQMETSFHEIIRLMRTTNVDAFPVLNKKGEFVGMIGLPQISKILQNEKVQEHLLARDLVTSGQSFTLNKDLLEVYNEMSVGEQDCLPVVAEDDNKKLIGIVTRFHVMYRYNKELVLLQGDKTE
ncbi:MAG: chloride channel protein [Candidatus Scalindua sp.]|jgi:CIC family chloride channel protein|nr:chloride channel protein [Candidatus Scalindua sp.]MBT6230342.1 chloride channel protein [Candidatus Scalindua sp.]MBT7211890.1 chloride channel protein [Candidatus Scalindua sp.]MBT7593169.1 chloride channel protein [Candidatus Scalindua sp.]